MNTHLRLLLAAVLIAWTPVPASAANSLQLTLPPVVYAVPGVPMSVYYDNIVLTETPEQYRFEVKCAVGATEARRWTVMASDKDVGTHVWEVAIKDAKGKVLESGKMELRVVPRSAGVRSSVRLLIVGDSLTHATTYSNEIARLLSGPDNPKWTMLGTHKPTSAAPGVAHEGYGGWRWETFLTKWEPLPPGVAAGPLARRSTSPFLYADADGKGKLDLPRYIKEECGGKPPDVVTFLLGINDCFGANPEDTTAMDKTINATLDNAEKLLAAFRAVAPDATLAVGLTTPPNTREAAFEANYKGKYHRWGWKRIQHRLVQRMMERMGDRQKEHIFLVPTELNLDPVDGYPDNNAVHPNAAGYAQIGVSFYAWMKAWMGDAL